MKDKTPTGMHPITRDLIAIRIVFRLRYNPDTSSERRFETEEATAIRGMIERNTAEELGTDFFVKSVLVNSDDGSDPTVESVFSIEVRISTLLKFISYKEFAAVKKDKSVMVGAGIFRDLLKMFNMFSPNFDHDFSDVTVEHTVNVDGQEVWPTMRLRLQSCEAYLTELARRNKIRAKR